MRRHGGRLATAALLCALLHVQQARGVYRRSELERQQEIASSIPAGYVQSEGFTARQQSAGGDSSSQPQHSTVMFTAGGGMYTKPLVHGAVPPRRLTEALTYQNASGASLNPDLSCQGCPESDTRVKISDTTETPWDGVGLLARQDASGITNQIAQCSGSIIGVQRQHVLTAGHCLVDDQQSQQSVEQITFYPGLAGNDLPFGNLRAVKARVLQQYIDERQVVTPLALNYDFALITLSNAAPVGTSYFDIAAGQGTQRFNLTTAGYPSDKPGQDMWAVNCSAVRFDFTNGASDQLGCGSRCSNIVVHDCLSHEGQSGSGIWSTEGANNRTIRAVLTGALQESDGTTYNVGTQMNAFVYNTVVGWYNEDVTDGLTLAPPAPPARNGNTAQDGITQTLGNTSWWKDHWWWVALPVGIVVLLALGSCLLACARRCGCCGGKRSRPLVGAAYPPPYGSGYPNQQQPNYYGNQGYANGYGQQTYNPHSGANGYAARDGATPGAYGTSAASGSPVVPGSPASSAADSNYARYGAGYYNGFGTSGAPYPAAGAPAAGYPAR